MTSFIPGSWLVGNRWNATTGTSHRAPTIKPSADSVRETTAIDKLTETKIVANEELSEQVGPSEALQPPPGTSPIIP
jgi:hypothetical protein